VRVWSSLADRVAQVGVSVQGGQERMLFSESLCLALSIPLLSLLPPPRLQTILDWCAAVRQHREFRPTAADVARVVDAALRVGRPLVRRGCLTRGLALYFGLRRSGIEAELVFGMGRSANTADGYDGHAWISIAGEPWMELRDPSAHYAAIYRFSPSRQELEG
jgi:Transglutaminase-like superfamily